jgi:S-adenosylmethionine decarboxylase
MGHKASGALDSVIPIPTNTAVAANATGFSAGTESEDHFTTRNGIEFAGTHLILDFWGATGLDELERMESAMREAVTVAGATLLHIHLHHFTPNGGISGVAVLAESHISVHTWPERNYAAFDIFMCGDAMPEMAIPVLKRAFSPERMVISEHLRGVVNK